MAAIDPKRLSDLREDLDNSEDFTEIVSMSQEGLEGRVEAIKVASAEGDSEELMRAAHSLISTSLIIGAECLAQYCQKVQHDALEGKCTVDPDILSAIEEEARVVDRELRKILSD